MTDQKVCEILFFRKKEVQSLRSLCYDELFQFCFKMASEKYEIDSQQLKEWKIMLKTSLPSTFWQDLNYNYIGNFWHRLFNVHDLRFPRYYYDPVALQELEFSLPKGELIIPDDEKLNNLEYQFFDDNTNSLMFWLQDQDTLSKIIALLEATKSPIENFKISCNQNGITVLPKFFTHFQSNIKRLHIMAPDGTENLILDFINQSECQLEQFRLECPYRSTNLEAKKIRKFLQKQSDSLEVLDVQLNIEVIEKILKQFSQMKKLNSLMIWTDADYLNNSDDQDELLELLIRWTENSIQNDLLEALGKADCPIENYTWYGSDNIYKGKMNAKNISNFMKKHAKSLISLDLTKWLAEMEGDEIEDIFKIVPKLEKLESINVFALDLITPNEEDKFHRFEYFNQNNLELRIDSSRGDIHNAKVAESLSQLVEITQKIPLVKSINCNMTGIISENDDDPKGCFNKIPYFDK